MGHHLSSVQAALSVLPPWRRNDEIARKGSRVAQESAGQEA
jgi:hypothetical protein